MSKNQARLIRFMLKYPGWTTCGPDSRRTLRTLVRHGIAEVNEFWQMRLVTK